MPKSPSRKSFTRPGPALLQRFHLVLDLDATCVSSMSFSDPRGETLYKQALTSIKEIGKTNPEKAKSLSQRIHLFSLSEGSNQSHKMWTILRPDTFEFMEFAAYYFNRISVWSAGKEDYVNEIVSLLFPVYMPRPEIVLSWSNCERTFVEHDSSGRVQKVEKTFSQVSSEGSSDFAAFGKPLREISRFVKDRVAGDLRYMLILDDRCDIAEDNMENLIQIPKYSPKGFSKHDLLSESDTAFKDFTKWLMRPSVYNCPDVRKLKKSKIFGGASRKASPRKSPSRHSSLSPRNKKKLISDLPPVTIQKEEISEYKNVN